MLNMQYIMSPIHS